MKSLFVVGDSISMQYGTYLESVCGSHFTYSRKGHKIEKYINPDILEGSNGGDSKSVLAYLKFKRKQRFWTDILLINCGLHDIKKSKNGSSPNQIPIQEYKKNCNSIAELANDIADKTYRITTTHFDEEKHNHLNSVSDRYNKDNVVYNTESTHIMKNKGIDIIDLRTFTQNFGKDIWCDHVHFKENVLEQQAEFIFSAILDNNTITPSTS